MATIIVYLIFASILGALAKSKNRNVLAWGLIGGLFFLFAVLILILLPALCPICNQSLSNKDRKRKACSKCGNNKNSEETVEVYENLKLRPNPNNEYDYSGSIDINDDKLAEDSWHLLTLKAFITKIGLNKSIGLTIQNKYVVF